MPTKSQIERNEKLIKISINHFIVLRERSMFFRDLLKQEEMKHKCMVNGGWTSSYLQLTSLSSRMNEAK